MNLGGVLFVSQLDRFLVIAQWPLTIIVLNLLNMVAYPSVKNFPPRKFLPSKKYIVAILLCLNPRLADECAVTRPEISRPQTCG